MNFDYNDPLHPFYGDGGDERHRFLFSMDLLTSKEKKELCGDPNWDRHIDPVDVVLQNLVWKGYINNDEIYNPYQWLLDETCWQESGMYLTHEDSYLEMPYVDQEGIIEIVSELLTKIGDHNEKE